MRPAARTGSNPLTSLLALASFSDAAPAIHATMMVMSVPHLAAAAALCSPGCAPLRRRALPLLQRAGPLRALGATLLGLAELP